MTATDKLGIVERLRANEPLPVCPYDRRSPDYWTTDNDKPCVICGTENRIGAPDLCRGADTRIMIEAAALIEELVGALDALNCSDILGVAESCASGMPRWDHVNRKITAARALLAKARSPQ